MSFLLVLAACSQSNTPSDDDAEPALVLGDTTEEADSSNVSPEAEDDVVTTWPWLQTTVYVLSNDTDANGDSLDIAEVSDSEHGSVTISGSTLMLVQTDDYVGTEELTYTTDDGRGGTDTATLTVSYIEEPVLVITAPSDGAIIEGEDVEISFTVTGCDIDSPSNDASACHLHKYLDKADYADEDGTGFGHYDADSFTITPIDEGEHTFSLRLISNDGSDQAFTPMIYDTVSFTVIATEDDSEDTGSSDTGSSDTGSSDTD